MGHKHRLTMLALRFLAGIVWLLPTLTHAAPVCVCSADKLIAYPGDIVKIRLLSSDDTATIPPAREWVVQAGRITKDSEGWKWDLAGIAPGFYKATLKPSSLSTADDACQIKVIVRLPPLEMKGGTRTTARGLLAPGENEAEGYGLYSYLLFAKRPDENSQERYRKAIEEVLKFPEVSQLEKYVSQYNGITLEEARKQINITYIPLTVAPDSTIVRSLSEGLYEKVSEWVLARYDYARAEGIIHRLQRPLHEGPYMVSVMLPQQKDEKISRYLFQDQTRAPAYLIASWVKEFLYQAAQENYWHERTIPMFVLKLRSTLGVLAIGLPEVQKATGELVQWVNKS